MDMIPQALPSIARGIPLSEETGLGVLTLPGYFIEVTGRFAAREALVMHHPDGGVERWTYAELYGHAMEIARALLACGVGKDSRVGVLMTNRPDWIAAVFGIGLAGGVAVTLSTFSTQAELAFLLQASGVAVLLFEGRVLKKSFADMVAALVPEAASAAPGRIIAAAFPYLRYIAVLGEAGVGAIEGWEGFLAHGADVPAEAVLARAASTRPADAGVLFFSSGSTGKPKGILSAHRGVAIQCWRWRRMLGLGDDVRCWTANGFFWSGNFGMAVGATFSSGGCLVLQAIFDPGEALRLMEAERVSLVHAWPHQWAQLTGAANWATTDLSSLHYIDAQTPLGRHSTVSTTWREPRHAYGNTETFTLTTAFVACSAPEITGETHGEPLPGCTIRIVDPMTGLTVPRGERGEIAVKSPTMMLGYIGTPIDETLDDDGFLRTGDGGFMDDKGRLVWEGRLNDIIKTGGANVSPVEVDAVLSACPGVKMNKTVGVPHETLGELVVSCVVPQPEAKLDEEGVRAFLRSTLASYKVPRRVLFVGEAALSMTGSAKVKTGELRQLAARLVGAV